MADGATSLELILHMHKCAGSTVETHLRRFVGEAGLWTPPRRARGFAQDVLGRKYVDTPVAPLRDIKAVSGHYIGQSIERRFPDRQIRRSMLMREPEDLALSWYNFRMMRYIAKGKAPYSLRLHLRTLPPDPMTHFVLSNWLEAPWGNLMRMSGAAKLDIVTDALSGFDRIAQASECDNLIAEISERLDIPEAAIRANTSEAWQAKTGWSPVRLDDLSEADRALLRRRTRLDRALFDRLIHARDATPEPAASFVASELARPAVEIARRATRRNGARPGDRGRDSRRSSASPAARTHHLERRER